MQEPLRLADAEKVRLVVKDGLVHISVMHLSTPKIARLILALLLLPGLLSAPAWGDATSEVSGPVCHEMPDVGASSDCDHCDPAQLCNECPCDKVAGSHAFLPETVTSTRYPDPNATWMIRQTALADLSHGPDRPPPRS